MSSIPNPTDMRESGFAACASSLIKESRALSPGSRLALANGGITFHLWEVIR